MEVRRVTYTKNGKTRESKKFYAVFADHGNIIRKLPLFESKKASDSAAKKVEELKDLRAANATLPAELSRWVESMPAEIRDRLASYGILASTTVAASKALAEHLSDWKTALLAKGNTPRHAELVSSRATKAFGACGFKFWSDLSASKLLSHLAKLREDRSKAVGTVERGISAQTFNFYLQAAKQFGRWMVQDGRATENPLAHLQGLNVKTDRRHDRRALSPDELRWLLDVTENGYNGAGSDGKMTVIVQPVERFGMSAGARAILYRVAVETGLRAGELRSLTRASFQLSAEPSVTIAAAYSKNRRQDTLPLRVETAELLNKYLASKMPQAQAFAVPPRTEVARMFRADLADARRAWLESHQSPQQRAEAAKAAFLLERDVTGRYADFHALRHTFITGLVTGGVNPKVAQTLARHSVITLTMDRYTHLYTGNLSSALEVLPDLSVPIREAAKATGTDGGRVADEKSLSPGLSPNGKFCRSSTEPDGGFASTPTIITDCKNDAEMPQNSLLLTSCASLTTLGGAPGRSGRAVECAGLENRWARKGPVGSNPTSSVVFWHLKSKRIPRRIAHIHLKILGRWAGAVCFDLIGGVGGQRFVGPADLADDVAVAVEEAHAVLHVKLLIDDRADRHHDVQNAKLIARAHGHSDRRVSLKLMAVQIDLLAEILITLRLDRRPHLIAAGESKERQKQETEGIELVH